MLCHPVHHHHILKHHHYHSRFEKEGVICGKQLGKVLRHIGQNPSEAEVTLASIVALTFVMVVKMVLLATDIVISQLVRRNTDC